MVIVIGYQQLKFNEILILACWPWNELGNRITNEKLLEWPAKSFYVENI